MTELTLEYKRKKYRIEQRLKKFEKLRDAGNEDIFAELCYCILTPQSRAVYCEQAIEELKNSGLLLTGNRETIRCRLRRVRFPNNKASYLTAARKSLSGAGHLDIKTRLDEHNIFKTRDWLVKNVKGLGYKEASHFLRNIGFGKDMAILDVHILRNLVKYGVINKIPKALTKNKYLSIENKLKDFSKKIGIPMSHLDLLFWSSETGIIFK